MVKIVHSLLKEYIEEMETNINSKHTSMDNKSKSMSVKQEDIETDSMTMKQFNTQDSTSDYFMWKEDEFVLSEYQEQLKKNKKYIKKLKKALEIDIFNSDRSAKILCAIDIKMYKKIEPIELIEYNGYKNNIKEEEKTIKYIELDNYSQSVSEISNTEEKYTSNLLLIRLKNRKLSYFTSSLLKKDINNFRFFYRLIKNLKKYRNYNSINSILLGIKNNKLNNKQLRKINKITKEIESINYIHSEITKLSDMKDKNIHVDNYFFIPPIEIILNDIITANRNEQNKVACKNFYHLVEFFIQLQNQEFIYKNYPLEFKWLYEMYIAKEEQSVRQKKDIKNIHLNLELI